MESIAYQHAPCQAQVSHHPISPDEAVIRQFWDEAKREVVKGDYLRRKWLPRQGHRFYTLIKVLRGYCSYSIKQGEAPCFPSRATIAQACRISLRTLDYWMARDEQGRFTHHKHGEALNRFVVVQPRRRYDPAGQRQVKTSNLYLVRIDDPVIPEEEALVLEKATALAIRFLEQQQEEQERETRRQQVDEAALRSAPFVERDCTLKKAQPLQPQRGAKTAEDRLSSPFPSNTDFHRSAQDEERAVKAIRSNRPISNQQTKRMRRNEEDTSSAAQPSTSNRASAQRNEDLFRRAAPLDEAEERQREEREAALDTAYDAAGGVVYSLLEELGDTNAAGGTRKVLSSLVAAGAPPERMADLAYLARDRVRAFVLRGGRIFESQVGFYITTLCNLAREARRKRWDVAKIAAADRRRHERSIRRNGQAIPQAQPARQTERRSRPPTPEEAEALVMELGQQPETYAKAQAQVRQMEERQQSREEHRQAVRQQAQLYQQLDKAEQALKTFTEGSLPWERAQREKQELERQLARLRQSAGEMASATPLEGIHHLLMQDRSEQEYREAIHAWAQARGWTVRHGTYGGSQRDWQIGLMAAGRAELRSLAAELGV